MLRWHLAIFPWIIGNKNETWWKTIEPPVGKAFIIERIVQWGSIGLWAPYTKTLVDKNQDARAVLWCSIVWIDEKLVSQEGKQTRPAVDSFFTLKKTIHAHKNTDLKLLVQIKIIAHFYFQLSARLLIFCEALLMYLTTPLLRFTELFFLSWFAENFPKMNETFNNNFEGKQAPERKQKQNRCRNHRR